MPRLFVDLARAVIVLFCLAIVLSAVWGQNLGQLAAALGVGSLLLGVALQEPVGNLFSGIMLMMERPVNLGDRIRYSNDMGMVVGSNWRSMHLRTRDNDMIVVPNGLLAKGAFVDYARPNAQHAELVTLYFSCDDAPNKVKPVLIETALRTTHVLADPAPKVRLTAFGDSAIRYDVKLTVTNFAALTDILEEFRTLVWYAARCEGLTMPYPHQIHHVISELKDGAVPAQLSWEDMEAFPHLRMTGSDVLRNVGRNAVRDYAKGEILVREGQRLPGLHLIRRGKVALSARDGSGKDVEFDRLERGEFFGEKSLLSASPSDATVTALEDLEVLLPAGESIDAPIDRNPQFSREISGVTEARRRALNLTRGNGNGAART